MSRGPTAAATGARVDVSYGASSALERQIEQGAPAQVFVSADSDWMDALQKKGLIVGSVAGTCSPTISP